MSCSICMEWQVVLDAVIAGDGSLGPYPGPCWVPREKLERAGSAKTLVALIGAGWLEIWEGIEGGPAFTLTPYAADQLGVELIEVGCDETPVWVRCNPLNSTRPIRLQKYEHEMPLPYPEQVLDPVRPVVDTVLDELSGEPLQLWGRPIVRDQRLKAG